MQLGEHFVSAGREAAARRHENAGSKRLRKHMVKLTRDEVDVFAAERVVAHLLQHRGHALLALQAMGRVHSRPVKGCAEPRSGLRIAAWLPGAAKRAMLWPCRLCALARHTLGGHHPRKPMAVRR